MKTLKYAIGAAWVLLPLLAWSQNRVELSEQRIERNRQQITVRFTVESDKRTPARNFKTVLSPYLFDGDDTLRLPEAEVVGHRRMLRDRQERLLRGERGEAPDANRVEAGEELVYSCTVPYERWMKDLSLGVGQRCEGCGESTPLGRQVELADVKVYEEPDPAMPFEARRAPQLKEANRRWLFSKRDMVIHYEVASTSIDVDAFDNAATLEEIMAALNTVLDDPDRRLNRIELSGYASPEGRLQLNIELSQGRAEALRDYLMQQLPELKRENFELINGAINWEGLRRKVEASDMQYRDEVLDIIDNVPAEKGRNHQLMGLRAGEPYRYMMKHFFPELRNACYISVYYDVLEDTAADTINRAMALIREGRYAEAREMLREVESDPRAFNAIGVSLMMQQQEEKAREWFSRALAEGDPAEAELVRENLKQIENY